MRGSPPSSLGDAVSTFFTTIPLPSHRTKVSPVAGVFRETSTTIRSLSRISGTIESPCTRIMRRFSGAAPPWWRIMFAGQPHCAGSFSNSGSNAPAPAATSTVPSATFAIGRFGCFPLWGFRSGHSSAVRRALRRPCNLAWRMSRATRTGADHFPRSGCPFCNRSLSMRAVTSEIRFSSIVGSVLKESFWLIRGFSRLSGIFFLLSKHYVGKSAILADNKT